MAFCHDICSLKFCTVGEQCTSLTPIKNVAFEFEIWFSCVECSFLNFSGLHHWFDYFYFLLVCTTNVYISYMFLIPDFQSQGDGVTFHLLWRLLEKVLNLQLHLLFSSLFRMLWVSFLLPLPLFSSPFKKETEYYPSFCLFFVCWCSNSGINLRTG